MTEFTHLIMALCVGALFGSIAEILSNRREISRLSKEADDQRKRAWAAEARRKRPCHWHDSHGFEFADGCSACEAFYK